MLNGDEFMKYIRQLNIVSTFINDTIFTKEQSIERIPPYLYLLVNTKGEQKFGHYTDMAAGVHKFYDTLTYLQQHPLYITDYPFNSKNDNLHIIVIKVDEKKFKKFIKGEYSKMYNEEEIERCTIKNVKQNSKTYRNPIYQILTHDEEYFPMFLAKLYAEFKNDNKEITPDREFDFPPYPPKEYLR